MKVLSVIVLFVASALAANIPSKSQSLSQPIVEGDLYIFGERVTYEVAKKTCEEFNVKGKSRFHLAFPINVEQSAFMYYVQQHHGYKSTWIGIEGGPDVKNRNWTNSLGRRVELSFWGPLEPNNFRSHNERCVEIRSLRKNTNTTNWNDAPCNHMNTFMCRESTGLFA